MSIPISGTVQRSAGVVSAIGKQLRGVNLKAAKRITVKFDPFGDNVSNTRQFLHYISSPKINATNPNCLLKTEIVCNQAEPSVTVSVLPNIAGDYVVFYNKKVGNEAPDPPDETAKIKEVTIKTSNLTCLEILQLLNKHISVLAPKEDPISTLQTKSEKKGKRK